MTEDFLREGRGMSGGGGAAAASSSSGGIGNVVLGGEEGGTGNRLYFDFFSICNADDINVGKSGVFSRGQSRYASKTVERMHAKLGY